jgi:Trypsin-like peptidase domain
MLTIGSTNERHALNVVDDPSSHVLRMFQAGSSDQGFEVAFGDGDFPPLEFPHPSQINIMPVVRVRGSEIQTLGTCFALSRRGFMVTARHVIEAVRLPADGSEYFGAVYVSTESLPGFPDFFQGGILPIQAVWSNPDLDIAFLFLRLPVHRQTGEQLPLSAFAISPGIPNVGIYCVGFGYSSVRWEMTDEGIFQVSQSYHATRGRLEEIHFPQRDQRLHFPCFLTNARFDAGMSGGPIFSQDGQICGVICSSMNVVGLGWTSYGSLLGPALAMALTSTGANGNITECFVWDLVTQGKLFLDATYEQINVTRAADTIEIDFGDGCVVRNSLRSGQVPR